MERVASGSESDRVLAAGSLAGLKLEMIQQQDGWLVITANGKPATDFRWPAEKLEQCVSVYLAMLRNRPHA